ncbi:MAG: hypothetical protein CMH54_05055 [Myxococcales bacterium]|nr:hypothetical protein [Myxococcales bacterium]
MVASLFLILSSIVHAAVPGRLDYQGYLTDAVGTPIHCDNCATPYTFLFSIYDQQVGGTLLWSEVHVDTDVIGGVFRVELGAEEAIDAALLAGNSWLEIQIDTQDPMVPRQRIVSVPYALRANIAEHAIESENAVSLGGQSAESFVTVTDTDVFLTETELGDILETLGFVPGDNDTLGDLTSCAVDEILKWDGSAWVCAVNADTDTLSSLLCASTEIAQWNGTMWICSAALDSLQANVDAVQANVDAVQTNVDTLDASLDPIAKNGLPADLADGDADTQLTEAEVLAMVAGAGHTTGDHFSGSWADLSGVPADLADGDDKATDAEILAVVSAGGYVVGNHFSGDWSDLTGVPPGLADGIDDNTDTVLSEAEVETFITNGSIDLAPGSTIDGATFATGSGVPSGAILMWSGSISDIPSGWALCDGGSGTPNLIDRFIVAAGASYGVGASGNGTHALSISTAAVTGNGVHGGEWDVSVVRSVSAGVPTPKYYALAYIMKL